MKDQLNMLFRQPFNETTIAHCHDLYTKFHSSLAQEEAFWKQRLKENWLKLGTKIQDFFIKKQNKGQKGNCLNGLYDDNGVWRDDKEGMKDCTSLTQRHRQSVRQSWKILFHG